MRVNFSCLLFLRNDGKEGWRDRRETQRTAEIEMILTASSTELHLLVTESTISRYFLRGELATFKKKEKITSMILISFRSHEVDNILPWFHYIQIKDLLNISYICFSPPPVNRRIESLQFINGSFANFVDDKRDETKCEQILCEYAYKFLRPVFISFG